MSRREPVPLTTSLYEVLGDVSTHLDALERAATIIDEGLDEAAAALPDELFDE